MSLSWSNPTGAHDGNQQSNAADCCLLRFSRSVGKSKIALLSSPRGTAAALAPVSMRSAGCFTVAFATAAVILDWRRQLHVPECSI